MLITLSIFPFNIESQENTKNIFNKNPLYKEGKFISVEKIISIPLISDKYQVADPSTIEIDENKNIYILEPRLSRIVVFNSSGEYLKIIGGPGEGPNELSQPVWLSYYNKKLFVIEGFIRLKILDLSGNYVDRITNIHSTKCNILKPKEDGYWVFSSQRMRADNVTRYTLSKVSKEFSSIKEVFYYNHDSQNEPFFYPGYTLCITQNNQIYFPDNSNKYKIIKYDENGKPILSFEREYKRKQFSKEARDNLQKLYGELIKSGQVKFSIEYPSVISKLLNDSRGNVWIVPGEIYEGKFGFMTDGTIDIFSDNGIWLYSFNMNDISFQSIIKNDLLYNVTKIDSETGQQYINIYKISYISN
jgi:hypothetical protein